MHNHIHSLWHIHTNTTLHLPSLISLPTNSCSTCCTTTAPTTACLLRNCLSLSVRLTSVSLIEVLNFQAPLLLTQATHGDRNWLDDHFSSLSPAPIKILSAFTDEPQVMTSLRIQWMVFVVENHLPSPCLVSKLISRYYSCSIYTSIC